VVALSLFVLVLVVPAASWAFGVKDVVAMSQYGISDSLIIAKIQHSDTQFDLDAKDLIAMKAAKVSDDVVVAMLRTEDANHAGIEYDGRDWPYDTLLLLSASRTSPGRNSASSSSIQRAWSN